MVVGHACSCMYILFPTLVGMGLLSVHLSTCSFSLPSASIGCINTYKPPSIVALILQACPESLWLKLIPSVPSRWLRRRNRWIVGWQGRRAMGMGGSGQGGTHGLNGSCIHHGVRALVMAHASIWRIRMDTWTHWFSAWSSGIDGHPMEFVMGLSHPTLMNRNMFVNSCVFLMAMYVFQKS